MRLSLRFREQFSGFLQPAQDELDSLVAQIQNFLNTEHLDDGTHATAVGGRLTLVAGAAIGLGQVVRIGSGASQSGAGRGFLGDATNAATSTNAVVPGVATTAGGAGETVTIRGWGVVSGYAGLVPGTAYYLASVPGAITATKPANGVYIGYAITATDLFVQVSPPSVFAGAETITWTGTTSGTANLRTSGTISFGAGTYSITANTAMTLTFKGAAGGGGGGGSATWDGVTIGTSKGPGGGGGGEATTGHTVNLSTGKTYTLIVGAGGAGGAGGGAVAGASGANGTTGSTTSLTNTTDVLTLVTLIGGTRGNGSTTGAKGNGGAGGTGGTGSNRVAGGAGGAGDDSSAAATNGSNATNGAAGGGGGGQSGNGPQSNGGIGGTGSVTGGARGVAGDSVGIVATAGASVSPATGGAAAGVHGGGGGGAGGGAQFSSVTGTFGGGGGGAGGESDSTGRVGGTGGDGVGVFVFVSAP